MRETQHRVHRDLPPTRMFGYGGVVPGPTLEARSGSGLIVEWKNELPGRHFLPIDRTLCGADVDPEVRTVVHVHGARVPSDADGNPDQWYAPGRSAIHHYPNGQDAATLWYHDHAMGVERLNHYAGLFGVFLVRDDVEDGLDLPRDRYEVPLVLCDRLLDRAGQLYYPTSGDPEAPWVSEVYGDAVLVNGTLFPFLSVEPRTYRLRVVNASNSRFFYPSLSNGMPFVQIGSDQGLLSAPVTRKNLTLAPAERADLIVDFSEASGRELLLQSQATPLLQFRVGSGPKPRSPGLPSRLRTLPPPMASAVARTRTLTLDEYQDPKTHRMLMLLNAARFRDPVTERAALGSTEIWELLNTTEDSHPIHLHLVRFRVLDRQPFDSDEYQTSGKLIRLGARVAPEPGETGWKDTVRADPGVITRILVHVEGYAGRYVWHCHLLEHAANEMMRPFEVVPRA